MEFHRAQFEAQPRDPGVLALADEVDLLLEQRGAVRKASDDLPRREEELAGLVAQIATLLKELRRSSSISADKIDVLIATLPSRARIVRLRELDRARTAVSIVLPQSRLTLSQLNARLEVLTAQQHGVDNVPGLASLRNAVLGTRKLGLLDEALRTAKRQEAEKRRELDILLLRLKPWSGQSEDLQALQVPAPASLDIWQRRLDDASTELKDAKKAVTDFEESLARTQLDRTQILRSGLVVAFEQLQGARLERDNTWTAIRSHLFGEQILEDVARTADDFQVSVRQTDTLSDERFLSAQSSARLAVIDDLLQSLQLKLDQANTRLTEVVKKHQTADTAWQQDLRARGLPALTPLRLREWLADRALALTAGSTLKTAHDASEDAGRKQASAIVQLAAALPPNRFPATPFQEFALALDHAEAILNNLEEEQKRIDRQAETLRTLESDIAAAATKVESEQALDDANTSKYHQAALDAGLIEDPDSSTLDIYDELRTKAEAAATLSDRISKMREDIDHFTTRLATLAVPLGLASGDPSKLLDTLKHRLTEAKANEQRAVVIGKSIERAEADLNAAHLSRRNALTKLDTVAAAAGSHDPEILKAFVARSREIRAWSAEAAELRSEILRTGDGRDFPTLQSENNAFDLETLEQTSIDLADELLGLQTKLSQLEHESGAAQQAFESLDKGPVAAAAAADAEMARAEMNSEAEAFILKRAEARVTTPNVKSRTIAASPVYKHPECSRLPMAGLDKRIGRYQQLRVLQPAGQPARPLLRKSALSRQCTEPDRRRHRSLELWNTVYLERAVAA